MENNLLSTGGKFLPTPRASHGDKGGPNQRDSAGHFDLPAIGNLLPTPKAGDADFGDYTPAIRRWEQMLGRPAPPPTELSPRGRHRLSEHFTEFMMGLPAGWITDTPGISRSDAIKAAGNGCVPQQVIAALVDMLDAFATDRGRAEA